MLLEEDRETNYQKLLEYLDIPVPGLNLNRSEVYLLSIAKFWAEDLDYEGEINSEGILSNYLGLKNAPAGKGVHHAYIGGLVVHLLEMMQLDEALRLSKTETHIPKPDFPFKTGVVRAVIILHDLHKAYQRFLPVVKDEKVSVEYSKKSTMHNMLTPDQVTIWMLNVMGICVTDQVLLNAVFNSEGGYAKNPPNWQSALAKYVYCLDELSVNLYSRPKEGNIFNVRDPSVVINM